MTTRHGILHVLGQRTYGTYVAGNAVSLIGAWMQRIGVGWLTWELTESGAWLGLVAFADLFPVVLVGPLGGVIADRVDRMKIIMIAQSLAMLQAFVLAVLTVTGLIQVELLVALSAVHGIIVAFNQPSRLAFVPSLVDRKDLPTAIAINGIVFNVARFVGPAFAGALILSAGVAAVFAANALSFLFLLLALYRIRADVKRETREGAPSKSVFGDIADGLRYAARHPGIGPLLLLLAVLSVSVRPFVELLPGLTAAVYGRGAEGLAILSSAVGIGAIAGGFWLARRRGNRGLTGIALTSALMTALAIAGLATTDRFPVAVAAVTVAGIMMVVTGVSTQTLLQLGVDGAMRGRVLSLYGIIFRGGPAVGALIMGTVSEATGLRWPLAGGALIAMAVWAWLLRHRRRIAATLEPDG